MAPAAVLLLLSLLSLLSSVSPLPPPRSSFLLNSADRPLVHFTLPDVRHTTTLLLSDDASTLYVGARDAVLSLDVSRSDVISLRRKVVWAPTEQDVDNCQSKGKQREVDCPNYVRVLQPINSTHLYACGSFAYSPRDAYIDTERFSLVQRGSAKSQCPFDPFQRNTAISIGGELFTATTSDFRGVKPLIARHFSKDGRPDVSQDPSVGLLEDPVFISSSLDPAQRKLYFFFSEVGKEFVYMNELRVARVAQVCKDDIGGQRTLQKRWTSFAKAPLLCQAPRRRPFDVLQDVFALPPPAGNSSADTLFYAVFGSQWSSGSESAVCVFTLQDIRTVFSGSYRNFNAQNHQWGPMQERHSHLGKCGLNNATDAELNQVKKSFLTSRSVSPAGPGPVVVSSEQSYSRVAATTTAAADGRNYTVLFLLTESGLLHKVVLVNGGARVVEEIQVFTRPQPLQSIVLSPKGVLYVGTADGVTAVAVARCSIYKTCSQCVLAKDPFCGWSLSSGVCTGLDTSDPLVQDVENGNVTEKCLRRTRARLDPGKKEVNVQRNEAVTLRCMKPSNLASLTWTYPQNHGTRDSLFIHSADGALSFFATDATFGTYRCEAEEGGYTEVVATYDVREFSPRSLRPDDDDADEDDVSITEEPYEDIATVKPAVSVETSNTGILLTEAEGGDTVTLCTTTPTRGSGPDQIQASREIPQSRNEPLGESPTEKSYYRELVVVSLLLGICSCALILGGIHRWRQRKAEVGGGPESGQKTKSMERVPSLSPEVAEPEVKVVQG